MLAGDTRSRGLLRGRRSRGVAAARYTAAAVVLVLLLLFQVWGLAIGVVLLLVVFGGTADTGTGGSLWQWAAAKRRWAYRVRTGFVDFIPVDHRPEDLTPTVDGGTRAERRAAAAGVERLPGLAGRGGRAVLAGIPPRPPRGRLPRRGR